MRNKPSPVTARARALAMLGRIHDRGLTPALAEAEDRHLAKLSPRDRAYARLLLTTTLRRRGQLDHVIAACLRKPLGTKQSRLQNLLRLGAMQLLFLDTPSYAAIDSMVDLARSTGLTAFTGLTNAVLRRIDAERDTLLDESLAPRLNTPDWLWHSWCAAYGQSVTQAIAAAHLIEPPLDLTPKEGVHVDALAKQLDCQRLPSGSLRRPTGGRIKDLPGYNDGTWWVQDAAAALPARMLGDIKGANVLDLCCAPGGKTAQLAAAGANVTALDNDPNRLALVADNLKRLRLSATLIAADVTSYKPDVTPAAILLDAPCTATGTIRRHPDILHRRTPEHLANAIDVQKKLLRAAAAMLPSGAVMVYAVCSLQPEEGPAQIAALLARDKTLNRLPITATHIQASSDYVTDQGDLRTLPCHLPELGGMDGFYACRLRRD
ncbi:MAG: RsmB/NOP family class I SAM-dependent RNA methyltransferase [Alphaproteobacteria bacterium]